jgi:CRISPR-associated protein Cas1
MLNEFVYCERLFYYEFVEGVFLDNADTLRGHAIHQRVDSGNGALPSAKVKRGGVEKGATAAPENSESGEVSSDGGGKETIHSRSVQMGSERLGVIAKMDLVEVRASGTQPNDQGMGIQQELFPQVVVCPVDYKAGAPREGDDGNELWDTDRIQLGLQALILRENGYACHEGIIYYRATKQRVHLAITPELEAWVLEKIESARRVAQGPIPSPLVNSPKCNRCSLAPVCLPDETRMLSHAHRGEPALPTTKEALRRLIAARDDTRPLYLNTPGYRIGSKDDVLQIKEQDKMINEVRIRDLSHVALFGNIQITTQSIQKLCEQQIPLTYFSMGGWFYGITRGHGLKNVFLRIEQFRLASDLNFCLSIARQFVHGKIKNQRTMLMRNHVEPPEPVLLKLKRAAEDALQARSIPELLGMEGAAASQYFAEFTGMLKAREKMGEGSGNDAGEETFNFNFSHRNRRPPTDPVNAMLSLAYSLLSKDCMLAALAVGYDPYIGFYHQPRFGRPALALDLMEEFRPLIAESTVLNSINTRVITPDDFIQAGEAVNLAPGGRKKFFQAYEQRMNSMLTHPLFNYKVSYRRALELQARLLGKRITGEIAEYTPLLTR